MELLRTNTFKKSVLLTAWACALIGIYFIFLRIFKGLTPSNLGNTVSWGLWVALYIYFIGLSAGSFLLSTLIYVFDVKKFESIGKLAVWQAFICLLLGVIFIWFDLGRMDRFINPILYFQPRSVLAWEIFFYMFYIAVLLAELYLLTKKFDEDAKVRIRKWLKYLGIIGIPVAIGVHGGTGAIFAVVKARPYWYSALFPIVFLVSALASGGALLLFASSIFSGSKKMLAKEPSSLLQTLARMVIGILAFDMLLLIVEFLVGMYGEIPEHIHVYSLIAAGPFWWVFWFVQLFIGVVLPIWIVANPKLNNSAANLGLAGLLIFIGIFGVRLNIVIPPLAIPQFASLPNVYNDFRMSTYYFPSLMEWASSIGIVSIGTLLFYYGIRKLKLVEETAET